MEKRIDNIAKVTWIFAAVPAIFVFILIENQTLWWTLIGILSFLSCIVFCGLYEQTSFRSFSKFVFTFSGTKIVSNAIPLVLLSILVFVPYLFIMIVDEKNVSIGSGLALISFIISSFKIFDLKITAKG
jgi:hypothetical protein